MHWFVNVYNCDGNGISSWLVSRCAVITEMDEQHEHDERVCQPCVCAVVLTIVFLAACVVGLRYWLKLI